MELARNLSFEVPGKAVHEEVSDQEQLTTKLREVQGRLQDASGSCAVQELAAGRAGCLVEATKLQYRTGSKTLSSCSGFPVLSTERLTIMAVDKGKLF